MDKISIKYLKNTTYLWVKPLPMFGMEEDGDLEIRGEVSHGDRMHDSCQE